MTALVPICVFASCPQYPTDYWLDLISSNLPSCVSLPDLPHGIAFSNSVSLERCIRVSMYALVIDFLLSMRAAALSGHLLFGGYTYCLFDTFCFCGDIARKIISAARWRQRVDSYSRDVDARPKNSLSFTSNFPCERFRHEIIHRSNHFSRRLSFILLSLTVNDFMYASTLKHLSDPSVDLKKRNPAPERIPHYY